MLHQYYSLFIPQMLKNKLGFSTAKFQLEISPHNLQLLFSNVLQCNRNYQQITVQRYQKIHSLEVMIRHYSPSVQCVFAEMTERYEF